MMPFCFRLQRFFRHLAHIPHPASLGPILALTLASSALPAAEPPADVDRSIVRIGVLTFAPPWIDGSFVKESMEYLNWTIQDHRFTLKFYRADELADAIRQGYVDIVAATAAFVRMHDNLGLQILTALASDTTPSPDHSSAGTVVTLKETTDIRTFADLSGRVVSVAGSRTAPGRLETEAALARRGLDPTSVLARRIEHPELRMRNVLEDVLSGRAEAGILRACFLEDLRKAGGVDYTGRLRVVNERTNDELACRHSTGAHPGWVIGIVPRPGSDLPTQITAALLGKPENAWGQHWLIATDFRSTNAMLRELRLGPYADLDRWAAARIWEEYHALFIALLIVIAGLAYHARRLRRVVAQRTQELRETHEREREALKRAQSSAEHLDRLQRAGVVGQMSSIIAHEMKQPLAVIQNLCRGMERSLENEEPPEPESLARAVRSIECEADRAAAIVERVRALAHSPMGERVRLDAGRTLKAAIEQFRTSRRSKANLILHLEGEGEVLMHPVDLELIVFNVLSNASEAASASPNPTVDVFLTRRDASLEICIRDNGPALSDEAFAALGERPLTSTKASGLGLGLMIVKGLVESAVGRLEFERVAPHGLLTRIVLPCAPDSSNASSAANSSTPPTNASHEETSS